MYDFMSILSLNVSSTTISVLGKESFLLPFMVASIIVGTYKKNKRLKFMVAPMLNKFDMRLFKFENKIRTC